MEEKEERLQQLYLEFQLLERHIKQLEVQSSSLKNQLLELIATNQSLDEMESVEEKREILVPISTGIYTKANLMDTKNFVVNVGANIAIVKDLTSTKKIIDEQIKEISKIHDNFAEELQKQLEKASSLEEEINSIASKLQEKDK